MDRDSHIGSLSIILSSTTSGSVCINRSTSSGKLQPAAPAGRGRASGRAPRRGHRDKGLRDPVAFGATLLAASNRASPHCSVYGQLFMPRAGKPLPRWRVALARNGPPWLRDPTVLPWSDRALSWTEIHLAADIARTVEALRAAGTTSLRGIAADPARYRARPRSDFSMRGVREVRFQIRELGLLGGG
jgi:hypothetical protein